MQDRIAPHYVERRGLLGYGVGIFGFPYVLSEIRLFWGRGAVDWRDGFGDLRGFITW